MKIQNLPTHRHQAELNLSLGENIRDGLIQAGIKAVEESAYASGNATDKLVKLASTAGTIIDRTTEFVGGSETASSIGKIAFKTTKDVIRGDKICVGLCLVAVTCETIAFGCSTCKFIPLRGKVYVLTKVVSKGVMTYRNLCAGEGC